MTGCATPGDWQATLIYYDDGVAGSCFNIDDFSMKVYHKGVAWNMGLLGMIWIILCC